MHFEVFFFGGCENSSKRAGRFYQSSEGGPAENLWNGCLLKHLFVHG